MYLALRVSEDTFALSVDKRDGKPSLPDMQGVVGGLIETAFRIVSPFRKNVTLDFYVNEEGLLIGLPRTFLADFGAGSKAGPFVGNMVVTATNEKTGNTIKMTKKEVGYVFERLYYFGLYIFDFRKATLA